MHFIFQMLPRKRQWPWSLIIGALESPQKQEQHLRALSLSLLLPFGFFLNDGCLSLMAHIWTLVTSFNYQFSNGLLYNPASFLRSSPNKTGAWFFFRTTLLERVHAITRLIFKHFRHKQIFCLSLDKILDPHPLNVRYINRRIWLNFCLMTLAAS